MIDDDAEDSGPAPLSRGTAFLCACLYGDRDTRGWPLSETCLIGRDGYGVIGVLFDNGKCVDKF